MLKIKRQSKDSFQSCKKWQVYWSCTCVRGLKLL